MNATGIFKRAYEQTNLNRIECQWNYSSYSYRLYFRRILTAHLLMIILEDVN